MRKLKTRNNKYSLFQKIMIVVIPIIVLLLIAAVVMCLAFSFLPMSASDFTHTGYLTVVLAACSAVLAIVGIIFAVFNKGKDDNDIDE